MTRNYGAIKTMGISGLISNALRFQIKNVLCTNNNYSFEIHLVFCEKGAS